MEKEKHISTPTKAKMPLNRMWMHSQSLLRNRASFKENEGLLGMRSIGLAKSNVSHTPSPNPSASAKTQVLRTNTLAEPFGL